MSSASSAEPACHCVDIVTYHLASYIVYSIATKVNSARVGLKYRHTMLAPSSVDLDERYSEGHMLINRQATSITIRCPERTVPHHIADSTFATSSTQPATGPVRFCARPRTAQIRASSLEQQNNAREVPLASASDQPLPANSSRPQYVLWHTAEKQYISKLDQVLRLMLSFQAPCVHIITRNDDENDRELGFQTDPGLALPWKRSNCLRFPRGNSVPLQLLPPRESVYSCLLVGTCRNTR
jgi:hypothetical protein